MTVLERAMSGKLDPEELEEALEDLLAGRMQPDLGAHMLGALHSRPVTPDILVAGANVLRRHSVAIKIPRNRKLIDTSGTGGDGANTVNLSTAAAILVAACDGTVAKQAFASADKTCGSLDVLAALGIPVDLSPAGVTSALDRTGFAVLRTSRFLPARDRLTAMVPPGGARALFRLWTPLANPAQPERQLVGVYDPRFTEPMARALGKLGAEQALVVHCGGLGEMGLHADTVGHAWIKGKIRKFQHPSAGIPLSEIAGGTPAENAARLERMFQKEKGPLAEAVALNAGAALWIGGVMPSFNDGWRWARDRLAQGINLDEFRA